MSCILNDIHKKVRLRTKWHGEPLPAQIVEADKLETNNNYGDIQTKLICGAFVMLKVDVTIHEEGNSVPIY
jgi:hypothetical protein